MKDKQSINPARRAWPRRAKNHERGNIMSILTKFMLPFLVVVFLLVGAVPSGAGVDVQCPGDLNGDAIPDPDFLEGTLPDPNPDEIEVGDPNPDFDPNVRCMHLGAGDGFVTMADGKLQYIFSYSDLTGILDDPLTIGLDERMDAGMLAATFPAPQIVLDEGDEFYLSLTNVGMMIRPDLFDPHTVHWHGFPEASSVFDGVPDASISINMGSSLTYYYNVVEPGTYMYHCHVEATEHMQMGMLGNLYVRPAQNKLPDSTVLNGFIHNVGNEYAYNDGDGSTFYDVDYAIQIGAFDSDFHDSSYTVQPLPFAAMRNNYPMLNGRGYPDTVNPDPLPAPPEANPVPGTTSTQLASSLITADAGDRVLLRLSSLDVQRFYTVATIGIPIKVVGYNARLLRGPSPDGTNPGKDLYYTTNSVTLGGGESVDVILEIPLAPSGTTYFLYTTNLNYLSNNQEDFGGMMTEIVIN
ncbi:MAG: multicopper oxidase domain-containing protein [Deltaproteobacteria bacterium]|nr:multicopper oxidase domain-containing protein [Deltaproteobacteria bacterium]